MERSYRRSNGIARWLLLVFIGFVVGCQNDPIRCKPSCVGKSCGSDGCGGFCGACSEANETCNESGQCECAYKVCNSSCCGEGEVCHEGSCSSLCNGTICNNGEICYNNACCAINTCEDIGKECGSWSAGCGVDVTCEPCSGATEYCNIDGFCVDDCSGRACGLSPLHGFECGTCPGTTDHCNSDGQCEDDCYGRICGISPNRGRNCGSCPLGQETCTSLGNCETKLDVSDARSEDRFGFSVSISGDMAIVGAHNEDGDEEELFYDAGAAYIYQLENGTWVEKKKLTASDAQRRDYFGISVSISGNMAIVGAYNEDRGDEDPIINAGAAYIFQLENGTWVEKKKLTASDAQRHDYFGVSVSISGDIAIVGAVFEDEAGGDAGAAYVFQLENGEWKQKQKLTAFDAQANDWFGDSVSISGDVAIVGAYGEDGGDGDPLDMAGAAYIFQLVDEEWVERQKLVAFDAQAKDWFGGSVSISGDVAIVGASLEDGVIGNPNKKYDGPGASYIFQLENGEWKQKKKLIASDAQLTDSFGTSVSINGDIAIVGAPGRSLYNGEENEYGVGVAYIFKRKNGEWVEMTRLSASDMQEGDGYGISVSISENKAIVGADYEDGPNGDPFDYIDGPGAAYIYSIGSQF